jgi:hypothetical protein
MLTGLKSTRQHASMRSFMEQVKQMCQALPQSSGQILRWLAEYEIGILIDQGNFGRAAASLNNYETMYASQQASPQSRLRIGFYTALIHFGLTHYGTCLQQINRALNTHPVHPAHPLYSAYRLLNLMVHLELDNTDYLAYEVVSVERKLQKVQRLYQTEKVLLRFLKQWLKAADRNALWKDLHSRLQALSADIHQGRLFVYVDLVSWAEAKVRKIPFAQAVTEKAGTNNIVISR